MSFPTTSRMPGTRGNFATTMGNSIIYVVATIAAELVLGGLAAYALARKRPPGSDMLMLYFLVASTIPLWMYIVPLFVQINALKRAGIDARILLILVYVAGNAPLEHLPAALLHDRPADRAGRRGAGRWRERIPGADANRAAPDEAGLFDRRIGGRIGGVERVPAGAHIHSRPESVSGDDEFLQIRGSLRPRLGINQRRRDHHHLPGDGLVPGLAAAVHRGLGRGAGIKTYGHHS